MYLISLIVYYLDFPAEGLLFCLIFPLKKSGKEKKLCGLCGLKRSGREKPKYATLAA